MRADADFRSLSRTLSDFTKNFRGKQFTEVVVLPNRRADPSKPTKSQLVDIHLHELNRRSLVEFARTYGLNGVLGVRVATAFKTATRSATLFEKPTLMITIALPTHVAQDEALSPERLRAEGITGIEHMHLLLSPFMHTVSSQNAASMAAFLVYVRRLHEIPVGMKKVA